MTEQEFIEMIVEEAGLPPQEVTPETRLEEVGFDSIANMIVITLIDQHFEKQITAPIVGQCTTFGDVYKLTQ